MNTPACTLAVTNLGSGRKRGSGRTQWTAPTSFSTENGSFSLFDLPGFGVLALLTAKPFDPAFARALKPVCERLAEACLVCESNATILTSCNRLQTILHSIGDAVIATDILGHITRMNPIAEKLCGWRFTEAEGKPLSSVMNIVHVKSRQPITNPVETVLASGNIVGLADHTLLIAKDGSEYRISDSAAPIKDKQGIVTGVVLVFRDVTDECSIRESLHESQALQRSILDNTQSFVFIKDVEGRYLFINRMYEKIAQLSNEGVKGTTDYDRFPTDQADAIRENDLQVILTGKTLDYEETIKYEGKLFTYHSVKFPLRKADGEIYALCGISNDITERKRMEDELREKEERFRLSFNQQFQFTGLLSADGRVLEVNDFAMRAQGFTRDHYIGEFFWDSPAWSSLEGWPEKIREQILRATTMEETLFTEDLFQASNGEVRHADAAYTAIRDSRGKLRFVLVQAIDITERKQQQELILHQAHFDHLTGLPNRFLALDRLEQLIKETQRTQKRVAVFFMDLDDFKKVNDTLGHETGDQLLVQAARRMSDAVRGVDTIGRLGGDEFIMLLGGLTTAADARQAAETLLQRCREAFRLDDRELILTASLGIAMYPDDGDTPAELLRKADTAMYHAKSEGRNTYRYFTTALNREVSQRLLLEEQMHGALARGEFEVYFQPLIDVTRRTIVGAEALLRWHNQALGEISPSEFIPIAEQTGLIVPIGRFVLTEALATAAQWQRDVNANFTIAINLSPRQCRDLDLSERIEDAIKKADITRGSVTLEVTEGALVSDQPYIEETLNRLKKMGIRIAMDDFGTGYSSLSYLRKYPFHALKIDRSFINDMTTNPGDRELVNATIAMAHGLGLSVIAEGVETEEQFAYLTEQGCEFAQGFLFSRPVPAEVFHTMLTERQAQASSQSSETRPS